MNNLKAYLTAGLLVCGLFFPAGCTDYAQKKQAMEEKWNQSTALAQIPAITAEIERGRIKQAKEALVKCLRNCPDLAEAHYLSGRVYVIEGRHGPAEAAFERAVELNPEIADAWHNLGSLAVLNKDYGRALECYEKTHALEPSRAEYCISLSDLYAENGRAADARQLLEDALSQQPRELELRLALAALCRRLGDNEQAAKLYEEAFLLHGRLPEILEPCGHLYMAMGQWAKAADLLKQLAASSAEGSERQTQTMRLLAMSLFNAERFADALFYYDKLSVTCRDDADIWLKMAESALGAEDADKAAVCAEKALKLRPSWPAAFGALGGAQYLRGEYEDAIRSFNNIIDDDEFGSYGWLMSGKCYQKLGQTAQANAAFERLLKKQGKTAIPVQ